jgi:hypothetical protein
LATPAPCLNVARPEQKRWSRMCQGGTEIF